MGTRPAWPRRRGRFCPVGEALVARIGADIVTPPHQEQRRRQRGSRGCFTAYTGHGGAAAAPVRDGQRAGICRVAVQALADPREFG